MKLKSIKEIQNDLLHLSHFDVLIFGSYVEGGFKSDSDIDICILSHSHEKLIHQTILDRFQGQFLPIYELHIFETLPITIQYSIWSNYSVLFGNELDISEYLYKFRKIWRDCKHRIFENQFDSATEQWEKIQQSSHFEG